MNVVLEALLGYCKVRPGHIQQVTQRHLDRWWKKHGQPGPVPDLSGDVGTQLQQELGRRARALSAEEARRAMMAPEERPAAPAPVSAPARARPTPEGDEARVVTMKSAEAQALVAKHKLDWPGPHPTNPGITAMRAKNALFAFVRKGNTL